MYDLCKGCVLEGRCSDCGDVNTEYYNEQALNDYYDLEEENEKNEEDGYL